MNYLLATDGSEYSKAAALFLSGFDLVEGDHLDILHVISQPGGFGESYEHYDRLFRVQQKLGEKILDETRGYFKTTKAAVAVHLYQGYPYHEILQAAKENNADIIVIGSRGLMGVESFLLGSVTRKVAINAPMPVLVVKPPQGEQVTRPLRVLFATDGSPCAKKAAAALHCLALPPSTELTVIYVTGSPLGDIPERFAIEIDDHVKETVAAMKAEETLVAEELLERQQELFKGCFASVKTVVKSGKVAPAIIDSAKDMDADMIAIGCRGEKGLMGMLGGVSRRVLSYAPCSVLISKLPE